MSQAKGDFAALKASAASFQRESLALANRLAAAVSGASSQTVATLEDEDASAEDDDDSFPEDPESAQLLLLGAMYVEGIEGKESLLTTLAWLLDAGHHKQLKQLISYSNAHPSPRERSLDGYRTELNDPLAFEGTSPEEFEEALVAASQTAKQLPSAGIRGWDLVRYVHLVRLAYMGRLIPGCECWLHVRRLKDVVAQEFSNWRELSDSYLQGYCWWNGTAGPFVEICQRLLDHPRSPWRVFGW